MHCIVVATSENVHLVRVLTVLSSFERWHLQIKTIKDALLVVCVLQLYVLVQVVLDAQVLHEVLGFPQVPHLNIQVVSTGEQRGTRLLNKARTRNRIHNLRISIRKRLHILNLTFHRGFHFCRLTQIVNLNVALRAG